MLRWYGKEATRRIRSETNKRIDRASRILRDYIRVKLSRSQPVKIYAKSAGRSRKGMNPSKAGEYPKKVTGFLRMNVQAEMDDATSTARVGIGKNVKYGKYLELGTRLMARRPWLSKGLLGARMRMMAMLKRGKVI